MKRAFPPPSRAEVRATIKVFNPQPMRNPRPASLRPVYDRLSKVHGCRLIFRRSTSSPCNVKIAPNNGNILCWHGNELNECTCHHLLHRDGSLIVSVTVDSVSRNSKKVLSKINRVVQNSSSAPVHNSRAPCAIILLASCSSHLYVVNAEAKRYLLRRCKGAKGLRVIIVDSVVLLLWYAGRSIHSSNSSNV